jgi:fructokinase
MISGVGADELGERAITEIKEHGLSVSAIGISGDKRTGSVLVSLSEGIATYTMSEDMAWDHITVSDENMAIIKKADALVFGSLALRGENNRTVLNKLLAESNYAIFDLNLRPPFFTKELIIDMMRKANLIKMNDEELDYVCEILKITENSLEDKIKHIAKATQTPGICVTLGDKGAILLHNNTMATHPGFRVKVADTVGAGDSFFAGLIYGLLSGSSPEEALTTGCALGALVASREGANCVVTSEEITQIKTAL